MQLIQLLLRKKFVSQLWKKSWPSFLMSLREPPTICMTKKISTYKPIILKTCFYREYNAIYKTLNRSEFSCIFSSSFHTKSQILQQNPSGGNSEESSGKDPNKDDDNKKKFINVSHKTASMLLAAYVIFAYYMYIQWSKGNEKKINEMVSWNEFVHNFLSKGEVEEIIIDTMSNNVRILLHEGAVVKYNKMPRRRFMMHIIDLRQFEERLRETEDLLNIRPDQRVSIIYNRSFDSLRYYVIMAALILFCVGYFIKKSVGFLSNASNPFQITRAKFTAIDPLIPGSGKGVKFSDIAGSEHAKMEIMEFVEFLKNPSRYKKLGAKVPKGALLLGPPGCGKTLMAKAVATEGNVPFLAMNGPEFIEMLGGVGAARVRDLFKEAKARAPCIIYIDEVDAIGRKRSSGAMDGGSSESEQTLNQLLVELDGILTKEGVVLLASTNRLDILDKALLRPGRFDRHIMMELPTLDERKLIFDHHLQCITLESPVSSYSKRMAHLTLGFSGADIANVVNEAALHAARHAQKVVVGNDLEYAVERVVGGTEKRSQVMSGEEKRVIAYHEAGHTLVGWLMEHADALLKVSIIPRTNMRLGYSQYSSNDEKYLYDQNQLFEKMCMALGGRVAESLIFNKVTTNAQDDLEKVTKMAYAQVQHFGFSEKVGQVSFPVADEEVYGKFGKKVFSQKLSATIDMEASRLIFEAYKSTEVLLKKNIEKLKLLAEKLLEKETLNYEDVQVILGPPPHNHKSTVEQSQFESEIQSWKH